MRFRPVISVVIPITMILIAGYGAWNHVTENQTAWRGATGGMFSKVDGPGNRLLLGVTTPTGAESSGENIISPPPELAHLAHRARVRPSKQYLTALSEAWSDHLDSKTTLDTIEVWRTRFDGSTNTVKLELTASLQVKQTP